MLPPETPGPAGGLAACSLSRAGWPHSTLEHFGDTLRSWEASAVWFSEASFEELGQVLGVLRAGCFIPGCEAPWMADIDHGASHTPSSGRTAGLGSLKTTGMSWGFARLTGARVNGLG